MVMRKSQSVLLFKSPNYEISSFTRMLKITETFYISLGRFEKAKQLAYMTASHLSVCLIKSNVMKTNVPY